MNGDGREGRIVTFYSFKGGVGRTMALANVAFLAAMNGLKVLAMDWDLEAPGLSYYFRGLLEYRDQRAFRDIPGILDIACDWRRELRNLDGQSDPEAIDAIFKDLDDGEPFESCLCRVPRERLGGGVLDFIGTGASRIEAADQASYEEVLARFSWPTFIDEEQGGLVLDALRRWAKRSYDLVLIDSRTGLADVSGLCTMLLPDQVALCFVLNRQNIDGIARVAAAIRAKREDSVEVRLVPMRVARQGTAEESDARARATSEMVNVALLRRERVDEDFATMTVLATESVPFYESLAPFVAADPSLDPLTLNYLRLASQLTGRTLRPPTLPEDWIEQVRRRLVPKNATIDYVRKLKTLEPQRALDEISSLLESAIETCTAGTLDPAYVRAIVDAAFDLNDDFEQAAAVQTTALDLLRKLAASEPAVWRRLLADSLAMHLDLCDDLLEDEEKLLLIDEAEGLLAEQPTFDDFVKRVEYRQKAGWIHASLPDPAEVLRTVGELTKLLYEARRAVRAPATADAGKLLLADIDVNLLRGAVYADQQDTDRAVDEYRAALEKLEQAPEPANAELENKLFDIHRRLATIISERVSAREAVDHALAAVAAARGAQIWRHFNEIASAVLRDETRSDHIVHFLDQTFGGRDAWTIARQVGPLANSATGFLDAVARLIERLPQGGSPFPAGLQNIAETANAIGRLLARRLGVLSPTARSKLARSATALIASLRKRGIADDQLKELQAVASKARPSTQKPRAQGTDPGP